MRKIAVSLDSSILRALVDNQRSSSNLRACESFLELIKTKKIIAYVTKSDIEDLIRYIDQDIDNQKKSHEIVSEYLQEYPIKIKDVAVTNNFESYDFGNNVSEKLRQTLFLFVEFQLDVLIYNDLEQLREIKKIVNQQPIVFQKLWVLTPRIFLRFYEQQQKFEQQHQIESGQGWQYLLKNISSEKELEQIHKFEQDVLPINTSLHQDKLTEWWQTYPKGIKCLFLGENLLAVASIWPLSEESAQYLRSSVQKEAFLEQQLSVMPYQLNKSCQFWYIGGVYLQEELRKKRGLSVGILQDFLAKAFVDWIGGGEDCFTPNLENKVTFFSIPVNPLIYKLLIQGGFQKEKGQTIDGFPLLSIEIINQKQLWTTLEKFHIY